MKNNDYQSMTGEQNPQGMLGAEGAEEGGVKIDGFAQVLAMLQIADNEFRESLLKRLAGRDRRLAAALRAELQKMDN